MSEDHQLNFIFNDTLIDSIKVTCAVQDETLNAALKKILNINQLSYEFISQNTIIIRRRDNYTKTIHIINGTICDAETGLPLVYANAYIQGRLIGSSTDTLGNFTLKIPSDSTMQLTVNYLGYETETKQIGSRSETLNIKLYPRPLEIIPIVVTASPLIEDLELKSRAQLNEEYFIGVVPEIYSELKYASFMLYNNNQVFFKDDEVQKDFYIRITGNRLYPMMGSDRNNHLSFRKHQVKLNGFSLQMPYHTTLVPATNPGIVNYNIIQDNNYNNAVFDVEFANAYESVLELKYRKGNQNKLSGMAMIDLTNTDFTIEGPITDKASWIINGKKSYKNDLLDSIHKNKWISQDYSDFQAQLDYQILDKQNIRFNYLYSNDQLSFNPQIYYIRDRILQNTDWYPNKPEFVTAEEHIKETNLDNTRFYIKNYSIYNSFLISDKWKNELSVLREELNYHNRRIWSAEHDVTIPEISDSTYNTLWSEGKNSNFKINSWDGKCIFRYDSSPAYSMKIGIQFEQLQYLISVGNSLLVRIEDNVSEPPNYNINLNNSFLVNKYSWYYQEHRQLFDKLNLYSGLRYSYTSMQQKGQINPRIMIKYDLQKDTKLNAAYGKFTPLPDFGEMQQVMMERSKPGYKSSDEKITCQNIDKYMISFEKTFASYALLNISYFFENMKNLIPIQRLSDGSLHYDVLNRAEALKHYLELNSELNFQKLSVTLRYKFSDSQEINTDGKRYPYYGDQKHSFLLSVNTLLPYKWHLGLQIIYGSGYAYTQCVSQEFDWDLGYDRDSTPMWEFETDNPNSTRYPGYSRLDISFRKKFTLDFGNIIITANLYNLLNTRHTFSYIYTYDQDGKPMRKSEKLISFFPQIGLAYEF
ncbi:MAG: carboxypeptidase-like regulatory domain-containing protein [Calditrichaceae bacterium]|nr:carboxypeptidase-like regulatory domain-containing protein [Calditrichaceae bacterium]MBN2708374.1 carboxypeptidase-like regulatory domain-containing protein [Calditrichaceae bacterium]